MNDEPGKAIWSEFPCHEEPRLQSAQTASPRVDSWRSFKAFVAADFRSRGGGSFARSLLWDPVTRFTVLMRLLELLGNRGTPTLVQLPFLIWYRRLSVRLGFSLAPGIFGPGLAIVHYGLLAIDPTTRVGRNCRIHSGVVIGGPARFVDPAEAHLYSPRIGDNVYIGAGAKLFGPIVIGDDCVIGANAVVTHSFPEPGLTIAGVPAYVIGRGGSGERVLKGADQPPDRDASA